MIYIYVYIILEIQISDPPDQVLRALRLNLDVYA